MSRLQHKRGDTLDLVGTADRTAGGAPIVDFTGWQVRCQIRARGSDAALGGVSAAWVNAAQGAFAVTAAAAQTRNWSEGQHEMDIEFEGPDGAVISTPTLYLEVVRDVTRPD
jgi:hypothetical protein